MVLFRAIDLFLKIINLVLILFFLKKMKYVGKKKEFKVQNVNGLNKKKIIELGSLENLNRQSLSRSPKIIDLNKFANLFYGVVI